MRRWPSLLLLLLLWLPGPAAAGSEAVTLDAYTAALDDAAFLLEQAQRSLDRGSEARARLEIEEAAERLSSTWRVRTQAGELNADLSDLQRALHQAAERPADQLHLAQQLVREHLAAARELAGAEAVDLPGARESLDQALAEVASQSVLQRARNWLMRLFTAQLDRVDVGPVPTEVFWTGGIIGALALGWVGYSLYRMLTGHGAGEQQVWKGGPGRATERPPTPSELLESARRAAGQGEYLEALRRAHLALLQHLDSRGLIRFQPAQTNREHEAQLRRRHPALVPTLRSLNDLVDERLYSGQPARVEDFMRAESLVEQLWREGDAASQRAEATHGRSSSASSR
jgi:hypothetical protein